MAALEIQGNEISVKQLKPLLIPVAALIVIITLFFFAITQALGQIEDRRQQLSLAKKDERTLEQKQQVLSELTGEVTSFVNVSSNAVPEKNASLMMISQVKSLAGARLLLISDLKISRAVEDGALTKAQLQFDIDGGLNQVTAFLQELEDSAPLSRLDAVGINQSGDVVRASITLSVYSASFPEQLPAITEPLADLTDQEREVLGILAELQSPPFSAVDPEQPGARGNPFE